MVEDDASCVDLSTIRVASHFDMQRASHFEALRPDCRRESSSLPGTLRPGNVLEELLVSSSLLGWLSGFKSAGISLMILCFLGKYCG